MKKARDEGIPDAISRTAYWRARNELIDQQTNYGSIVRRFTLPLNSGDKQVAIQSPQAMLTRAMSDCGPFATFVRSRLEVQPCSQQLPWNLVLYCDEIGHNPLGDDRRKCEALYWSFAQFGAQALATEACWFKVMVVRSMLIAQLDGGMSNLWKIVLKDAFFGTFSFKGGVLIADDCWIFADVGFMIADEKALKEVLFAKGAGGFKFCPSCWEICDVKATDARKTACLSGDCLDVDKLRVQEHTDASVRGVLLELQESKAKVASGTMTNDAYQAMETFYGWSYHPQMLLLCSSLALGAVSLMMHDYSHIYTIAGIFQIELQYLLIYLKSMCRRGDSYYLEQLDSFMKKWKWPRGQADCSNIFNGKFDLTRDNFKCDSHVCTQVYYVIALYLALLPDEMYNSPQVNSFLALCDVLDLLRYLKDGSISATMLHNAIMKHLRAFKRAYGNTGWIPKHHLAYHLSRYLRKWGFLQSTLTQERMHKLVKTWSRDRFTCADFEFGLMSELALEHLHDLKEPWWFFGLQDPVYTPKKALMTCLQRKFPGATTYLSSPGYRSQSGNVLHAGDVIFIQHGGAPTVGELWWLAQCDDTHVACVSVWTRIIDADAAKGRGVCFLKQDAFLIMTCDHLISSAAYWDQGDRVICIVPAFLQMDGLP